MKFNQRINALNEWFHRSAIPRITAPYWVAHQLENSAKTYIPALLATHARKSTRSIVCDLAATTVKWRCLPFHYLRYELYALDMSRDKVLSHIPDTVFYSRILPKINAGTALLDDKVTCKRILATADIQQPSLIAVGENSACWTARGEPIVASEILELSTCDRLVIKPARNTAGGDGVQILRCTDRGLSTLDGEAFDLVEYARMWGAWFIESYVQQHHELAILNPHSLNTLRVITRYGEPVFCILKSGAGEGAVDNACSGGLYVRVDPETGQLDPIARTTSMRRYAAHPVTGVSFGDLRVTAIKAVLDLARRAAALFPQTPLIGWDIAVTGSGTALIIEGNSSPSLLNIQRTHGGLDDTLGSGLLRRRVD